MCKGKPATDERSRKNNASVLKIARLYISILRTGDFEVMKPFLVALYFLVRGGCSFSLFKGVSNEVLRDISEKSLPASFLPTSKASRSMVMKGTSTFLAKHIDGKVK